VPKGWREGDVLFVAEASPLTLSGSEYQSHFGEVGGAPGTLDLAAEARLVSFLWRAASGSTLVHDAAEGGLAVCLAESAIASGCGAKLKLEGGHVALFGEVGGRAVLACEPELEAELRSLAGELGVPLRPAGTAGGGNLLGVEVARLRDAWEGTR
jgi:phosphoribosylformylglycinamidine synthase